MGADKTIFVLNARIESLQLDFDAVMNFLNALFLEKDLIKAKKIKSQYDRRRVLIYEKRRMRREEKKMMKTQVKMI